jgi:hypothetical protein
MIFIQYLYLHFKAEILTAIHIAKSMLKLNFWHTFVLL